MAALSFSELNPLSPDTGDEDVLDATVLEFGDDLQPELSAFGSVRSRCRGVLSRH